MSEVEFAQIAEKLVRILIDLRKNGDKHGDISPANIMFKGNDPVLIDFSSHGSTYSDNDASALGTSLLKMRFQKHYKKLVCDFVEPFYSMLGKDNKLTRFFFRSSYSATHSFVTYFNLECVEEGKKVGDCLGFHEEGRMDLYITYKSYQLIYEKFKELFHKTAEELENLPGISDYCKKYKSEKHKVCLILEYCYELTHEETWKPKMIAELKPLERSLYQLESNSSLNQFQKALSLVLNNGL